MKAQQTFAAYRNLNKSVIRVYDDVYSEYLLNENVMYVGIKDTKILRCYLNKLPSNFKLHTIDKMAFKGRGIDVDLVNPLTFNKMTGSSSGTAINVLLGINDLGIGTDGGGSVLAPAISLNLVGFISPLLPVEKVSKFSTDDLEFSPSAGFISKDIKIIKSLTENLLGKIDSIKNNKIASYCIELNVENYLVENLLKERKYLIEKIKIDLETFDYIISKESNIDILGYGESVHGILSNNDAQVRGNKGLLRVVNMIGATALSISTNELSTSYLIITKSEVKYLEQLFEIGNELMCEIHPLISKYFNNEPSQNF